MMDIAHDTSLNRRRLGASDGCLLTTRLLHHSGSTFKKFVVRRPDISSVRFNKMFKALANKPSIQHGHIAPEEVINGSDGPPGRLEFEDAILFIVTPTFNLGNIIDYLTAHPQPPFEKLKLIAQISSALCYLHSQGIVHGNVSPTNILIADDGRAMLTDIGVNSTVVEFVFAPCGHIPVPHMTRYKPPEEVRGSDDSDMPQPTTDKDVYSLASSAYEVVSGKTPFGDMRLYTCVIKIARDGHLCLTQSDGITDGLWQLLQACWAINPAHRPKIEDVQGRLEALLTVN